MPNRAAVDTSINTLISKTSSSDKITDIEHREANKQMLDYADQQDAAVQAAAAGYTDNAVSGIPGSTPGTVIAFTASLPLTRSNTIMNKVLTANLVLTEDAVGQLPGAGGTIRITQDSTPRTVTFPAGWIEKTSSEGISTTAGMVHEVTYKFNGTEVSYTIERFGVEAVNQAPTATSVAISGTAQEGQTLTGSHTYADNESDPAGTPVRQWYKADDTGGTNRAAISGATNSTYIVQTADVGKYLQYGVIPTATSGTTPGAEGLSSYTSIVLAIGANQAPVASSVAIAGTAKVGQLLTGSYVYTDNESDAEGATTKQWYRANDGSGTGRAAISGATGTTYTVLIGDLGKFIQYEVTPVAATGSSPGSAAVSSYTTAVLENVAPTLITGGVAVENATPSVVDFTFDEALAAGHVPLASDFAITGHTTTGTVTITGSTVHVPVTVAFTNGEAARTGAYTPGLTANKLQDAAGNLVAAFSGQAITNNVAAGVVDFPSTLTDLDFTYAATDLSETGGVWTPGSSAVAGWDNKGLGTVSLPAGTSGRVQHPMHGGAGAIGSALMLSDVNAAVIYTSLSGIGFGSDLSANLFAIENGTPTTLGAVNNGFHYCIDINGATGVARLLEASDDAFTTSMTVKHTFSGTYNTDRMYPILNVFNGGGACYNPKCIKF